MRTRCAPDSWTCVQRLPPYTRPIPLEGHWERQHTPLRGGGRRELRWAYAIALVAVAAVAVTLAFALHHGSPGSRPGCIDVTAPSTMGGVNIHACGRDAARVCGSESAGRGADARNIQAACREAGY